MEKGSMWAINVIYQTYDIHILGIWHLRKKKNGIYLLYTKIIHGLTMVYDDLSRKPGIYTLKTFSDISVPVTYPSGYGIYEVYTEVYSSTQV